MKSTQPLPPPDTNPPASFPTTHDTHPLSLRWRLARPALLVFAGGAALSWLVSGLMSRALSTQTPPRSLPVAKAKAKGTPEPQRLTLAEWKRLNPADAAFIDGQGSRSNVAIEPQVEAEVLPGASSPSMSSVAMEVADSNEDGSAWKGFVARSDDDRRRISERREEDRMLSERRALEAEKKRIERRLEIRSLQEKYRAEDKQASDAAREEDKRRIQTRVDEDRKASDERERGGEQLAEAPEFSQP